MNNLLYWNSHRLYLWVLITLSALKGTAQEHMPALLNKNIPQIALQQASASTCLQALGRAGNIRFSYQTNLLPQQKLYTLTATNRTVAQLLFALFKDDYEYEEQAGYIIVHLRHSYFVLSGYVNDLLTGLPLEGAEVTTLTGAFKTRTSCDGYFELRIPRKHQIDFITARKDLYTDAFAALKTPADTSYLLALQQAKPALLPPVTTAADRDTTAHKSSIAFSPLGTQRSNPTHLAVALLFNSNQRSVRNLQLSAAVNITHGSLYGAQLAGLHNLTLDTVKGAQVSGLINRAEGPVKGLQLAFINRAGQLRGVQIGLINIADSSTGYSIGLFNIIHNSSGYHHVQLFATDITNFNLAFKLGNHKLYSVILAGVHIRKNKQLNSFGMGAGHDFLLSRRLMASAEVNYQFINAGSWDNRLVQLKSALNIKLNRSLYVFAGPVYNYYKDNQGYDAMGYKKMINRTTTTHPYARQTRRWIGWQIGMASSDILWSTPDRKTSQIHRKWNLVPGIASGTDTRGYHWMAADVTVLRQLPDKLILQGALQINKCFEGAPPIYAAKTGLRIGIQKAFYVAGDIALTLNGILPGDKSYNAITGDLRMPRVSAIPSIGWKPGQRWDASARYESLHDVVLVRLGYQLL